MWQYERRSHLHVRYSKLVMIAQGNVLDRVDDIGESAPVFRIDVFQQSAQAFAQNTAIGLLVDCLMVLVYKVLPVVREKAIVGQMLSDQFGGKKSTSGFVVADLQALARRGFWV